MDNQDVSKLKAKGRVELLVLFFVLVLAVGGVAEYRHATAPISSAMVVFDYVEDAQKAAENKQSLQDKHKQQVKAEIAPLEAKAPVSELNPPKAQDIAAPVVQKNDGVEPDVVKALNERVQNNSAEPKNETAPKNETNFDAISETKSENMVKAENPSRDGAAELTDYMQEIHQKAENVSRPQSALGQIQERQEVKKVERQPQPVFEAGKIEIYDSEKGVVAVQETVEVIVPEKAMQDAKMANKETAESPEPQVIDNEKKPEDKAQSEEKTVPAKVEKEPSVKEVRAEATSVEQKVVEPTKEPENVDANKDVTSEVSDKAQPTLLVPVKNEPAINNDVALKSAEAKPEVKQNSAKEAPVDMIKAMQEGKAPVEDVVKSAEVQENIVNKTEEISSDTVSEKQVTSELKTVDEKQDVVKEQIAEDKVAKSKKANEALENLFKKMSEPNALTTSASEEKVDEVVAPAAEGEKSESVKNESKNSQPIENNVKNNNQSATSNDENGAVDMMKAIISRK